MLVKTVLLLVVWTVAFSVGYAFVLHEHGCPRRHDESRIPNRRNGPLSVATLSPYTEQERISELQKDLGDFDEPFANSQWMMPSVVERALIHQELVDPFELLGKLDMSSTERTEAEEALTTKENMIVTCPALLTPDECARLRRFVDKSIKDDGIDDVDGCPDWQVNLNSVKKLQKILGSRAAIERLWKLPGILEASDSHETTSDLAFTEESFDRVGIFIRKYQRNGEAGRPWMPFHRDGNDWTVNVAVNADSEYVGGNLLALHRNKLEVIERGEGDATCHRGSVFHAVSAMEKGTRYSLILFFHAA